MAEIEISALSKQCLDRRINYIEKMAREIAAWTQSRNQDNVKIQWQFTKPKARENLADATKICL